LKKIWIACAAVLLPVFAKGRGHAQTLSFKLDRVGSPPTQYTIHVEESSGRGMYRAESPKPAGTAEQVAPPAEISLVVGTATLKKLLAAIPLVESGRCETHMKKIAQTGVKVLRYERDGKVSECTYNYSDDERVNTATSQFEAIGETMQYGDRLAAKLRFDRLGLDTEVDGLQSAIAEGRAVDVGNISPVLQAIENDDRVMDRVRRKVARVLVSAGATPGQTASGSPAVGPMDR